MPKVDPEYRARARERIVEAAQEVFRRKGFSAATMADIAADLGVSKGALYLYFRSKTALLAEIQRRSREQFMRSWDRLLEKGDVAQGIAASLDEVLSGIVDPGIWLDLLAQSATDPKVRAALRVDRREDLKALTQFLRQLEARGRIRKLRDAPTMAGLVVALLQAAVLDVALQGRTSKVRHDLVAELRYVLDPR